MVLGTVPERGNLICSSLMMNWYSSLCAPYVCPERTLAKRRRLVLGNCAAERMAKEGSGLPNTSVRRWTLLPVSKTSQRNGGQQCSPAWCFSLNVFLCQNFPLNDSCYKAENINNAYVFNGDLFVFIKIKWLLIFCIMLNNFVWSGRFVRYL